MTRVLVVTGTRADFGLWLPVIDAFGARSPAVDVAVLVMAMHLDDRFGRTVDEVIASGVTVAGMVPSTPAGDTPAEMASAVGIALQGVAPVIEANGPDWVMVLGDRGEQLAAAIAALHLGVAVAHVHGGERTLGAVDDVIRDLLTRIAHVHLVATDEARERLLTLGEEPWRITRTGAPGLDAILRFDGSATEDLRRRYGLPRIGPYLMVVVHPETGAGAEHGLRLADAVVDGLAAHPMPVVGVWPNADAGGRVIAGRLERERSRFATLEASIRHDDFIGLLSGASALVGNSSSGIIEAPMLGIPAVNIGRRQDGRSRGDNVIDVPPDGAAVADAISAALDPSFHANLSHRSPYGDGLAADRIVEVVISTPLDRRLFEKGASWSAS